MLSGVNRIWIADSRLVQTVGFRVNETRIGFTVNEPGFEELMAARGTTTYECSKVGNVWEHKVSYTVYSDKALDIQKSFKYLFNRYVVGMYLNSGETIIVGIDNPLRATVKQTTGTTPGEVTGYTVTFGSQSRAPFDYYDRLKLIPIKIEDIENGYLYNKFVIEDLRGIISQPMLNEGWAVPSNANYNTILSSIVNGGELKETGFTYWNNPNTGATNLKKFNGRGSGYRTTGGFAYKLERLFLMTSSKSGDNLIHWDLRFDYNNFSAFFNVNDTQYGFSLRLFRLANISEQSLSDGDRASNYVGNDGKVYRTVKIGTQVWLADNLAETMYKDKSVIPHVMDQDEWNLLSTGARCAYNNDPTNI